MAIFHLNLKTIGRSQGRSATGSAAYRAGEIIGDRRTGLIFDYSKKRGCDGAEILAPINAPAWTKNRAELWNRVEEIEKRIDAQVCREIEFSLPVELDREQMKTLARTFILEHFVSMGMIADVAFHKLDSLNPHAHCLLTMREITPEGFGQKEREWNNRDYCTHWRERWAQCANQALAMSGQSARIDHRTLEEQALTAIDAGDVEKAKALDHVATIHEARNPAARAHNHSVQAENRTRLDTWEAMEQQARAQACLMASSSDTRPQAASIPSPTIAAPLARPRSKDIAALDAEFRNQMASATGLPAIAWREADRRVSEFRQWLDDYKDEEKNRYARRDKTEKAALLAKAELRHFLASNPKPRNFWIFNRKEREEWQRRKNKRDKKLREAEKIHADAVANAEYSAILIIEKEREQVTKKLARAQAQRKQYGPLPSEQYKADHEKRLQHSERQHKTPAPNTEPERQQKPSTPKRPR